MTPRQIEKIKKQIKSERAFLSAEKRKFGDYFDNRGRRYIIAELYTDIKDYKGVLRYYNWFNKEFPDDIGFPEVHLSWIIAAIKEKKLQIAYKHLVLLEEINSYLIPKILGIKQLEIQKWDSMDLSTIDYANHITENCKSWIDQEIINFLDETTSREEYKIFKKKVIECDLKLNSKNEKISRKKILKKRKKHVKDWIQYLIEK